MHEALGNRNLADEQFRNMTLDELTAVKGALALEREERIAEDDEIVQVSQGCCRHAARVARDVCDAVLDIKRQGKACRQHSGSYVLHPGWMRLRPLVPLKQRSPQNLSAQQVGRGPLLAQYWPLLATAGPELALVLFADPMACAVTLFVQAINDYTKALQEGLKLVST